MRQLRSPVPTTSPARSGADSRQSGRSSLDTDSDTASNYAPQITVSKRPGFNHALPNFVSQKNASTSSINQVRPSGQYMPTDFQRKGSSLAPSPHIGHRPRQHSQGYFEPSMPSASLSSQGLNPALTPSQIAAQAAVQHLNLGNHHIRRRSSTVPVQEQDATSLPPTTLMCYLTDC